MIEESQSLQITKEIRTSDQMIIGLAERHGFPNASGKDPSRMIDPRYIREATSFYHTLERAGIVVSLNKLNEAAEILAKIQDPIERLNAVKEYIATEKLPK